MKKCLLFIFLIIAAANCVSAVDHQHGNIKNLTVVKAGIMIMIDSGMPDNCEGTPYGWLLIKQEHTAITSVVLAGWMSGNKTGTVYTDGRENGNGYCIVSQFDPAN